MSNATSGDPEGQGIAHLQGVHVHRIKLRAVVAQDPERALLDVHLKIDGPGACI